MDVMVSGETEPSTRRQLGRREATRTRVLAATVALIARQGFHASNLSRVSLVV